MITTKDRQAFSDVCIIIKMMPKSMEEKINPSFIKFIEDNKDTKYIQRKAIKKSGFKRKYKRNFSINLQRLFVF